MKTIFTILIGFFLISCKNDTVSNETFIVDDIIYGWEINDKKKDTIKYFKYIFRDTNNIHSFEMKVPKGGSLPICVQGDTLTLDITYYRMFDYIYTRRIHNLKYNE